ncbi:hypothetical protein Tel_06595 [Candidatus Tenderia electrophaga]|jgi:aminobenzoyl-glutamate transport protein|uniref:Aminobenzoyl-glutamate transporter n=1 Tax=Candidatus Tenderia electrophaga TaxID=1748243 RepID=A0A0S2TCJ8_9GAMM|nr:hypothetical protein Tel_06595 [Candidatus Tenderia electrophaga]
MAAQTSTRLLAWVERTGNRLPHPATLFGFAALGVMLVSQLAAALDWRVSKSVTDVAGVKQQVEVEAVGLLDSDGIWWVLSHLVDNFINFPPLGLVLVAMIGIGVAERSGLVAALLQSGVRKTPGGLLTPMVFFLGVMSSMALDAGYVVLPPLAAALYLAMGRSPLAGIAVAFAAVSAGFSANLLITALDPLLAGFSQAGAQLVDQAYRVSATANWWFMIASTIVLTLTGWWVTARIVEPRLAAADYDYVRVDDDPATQISADNMRRGLKMALVSVVISLAIVLALIFIPDAPLYGQGERFARWIEAIVPLILILFLIPGLAYGFAARTLQSEKDVARLMSETMSALGPYIVLAFFAAQFIAFFNHSNLGEMLAVVGGQLLAQAQVAPWFLIAAFVMVVMLGNLFIGSASAKYAFFAPVFVPMFMQVGISPELTQAAYRVGDSVSNVITPLNPYMVIVLAFLQRYLPQAGFGTLAALMLPYVVVFAVIWIALLLVWMVIGVPLGPAGPLWYQAG